MNKFKKFLAIIFLLLIVQNIFSFCIKYTKHIINAPKHLVESNKYYIPAKMFADYYGFCLRFLKMDLDNILLYPLREPMLYFYHKGLDKLDINEPIRTTWFNEFELTMYIYSTHGKNGKLTQKYGKQYAKRFIDDLYSNLVLLATQKEAINKYKKSGYDNELTNQLLQTFILYVSVFIDEFHLAEDGYNISYEKNLLVSNNTELNGKFRNILYLNDNFLKYYKENYLTEYNAVMDKKNGWFSPYKFEYMNIFEISSYVLFYEITNKIFDCNKSKKYLDNVNNSKEILLNLAKDMNMLDKSNIRQTLSFLGIKNLADPNKQNFTNPMKHTINCK